jgi:hypothetical protein
MNLVALTLYDQATGMSVPVTVNPDQVLFCKQTTHEVITTNVYLTRDQPLIVAGTLEEVTDLLSAKHPAPAQSSVDRDLSGAPLQRR